MAYENPNAANPYVQQYGAVPTSEHHHHQSQGSNPAVFERREFAHGLFGCCSNLGADCMYCTRNSSMFICMCGHVTIDRLLYTV